ncbi:relaxase/mobilization nuclease domain-containing protein [Williamsia muralis]|uniref:relaxase/mobilization nuclease domain-containing protein n=1 Tax=Williamsia marianensis TaxID=85044 RepID=UPI000DB34A91|nr:hypothetical protein [Williamsia marianensis]PVY23642.1 hypothetical protein C7458_12313 [Williamsia marianensis]PZT97514.1 MAG: hypothetical protein DI630_21450 [Gordonia sp. (in: high G+C Gram-positive bacteria)]
MRGKITRGQKMAGLIYYLQGPGKHNEHTNPHMVAGRGGAVERFMWSADSSVRVLSKDDAIAIARELDEPHVLHDVKVPWVDPKRKKAALAEGYTETGARAMARVEDANVWQCSLALRADEAELSDELWGKIAEDFMREMGFDSVDPTDAGSRWVAIHHGKSANGNDHIHIAASMVREDGSLVKLFMPPAPGQKPQGDGPRSSQVIQMLERKYNLQIDRDDQAVSPSYHQAEVETALQMRPDVDTPAVEAGRTADTPTTKVGKKAKQQRGEPVRFELARRVRAAATAANDEADFVELLAKQLDVVVRPRWSDTENKVVGYSVGLVPPTSDQASVDVRDVVWYSGTSLGRDLTITQLRRQWGPGVERSSGMARRAWRANAIDASAPDPAAVAKAREKLPYTVPDELAPSAEPAVDAADVQRRQLERARQELAGWTDYVRSIPAEDGEQVARAAGVVSGVFAAWSARTESTPGPLAHAANTLARTASRRYSQPRPVMRRRSSGTRAAAMLMMASAHTDPAMAWAMVMGQLLAAVEAIADAQAAANNAAVAQRLVALREQQLNERMARVGPATAVLDAEPARRYLTDEQRALWDPRENQGPSGAPQPAQATPVRAPAQRPPARRSDYDEMIRRRGGGPTR